MSETLGGLGGACIAVVGAWCSCKIARRLDTRYRLPTYVGGAQVIFGCITGALAFNESSTDALLLAVICGLLVVQSPIDLALHRLARMPTALATILVACVYGVSIISSGWQQEFTVSLGSAAGVVAIVGALHRISSHSLGWGDVLLMAPLALAVSFVDVSQLPVWLMIAAGTAAIHGALLQWLRGEHMLPFGPHLLFAAWLVLLVRL